MLGLPDVFRANTEGPWIQPDNASAEMLAAVARDCPSGAITYERIEGAEQETPPPVNLIRILENGPLAVHADLKINEGKSVFRATICRCGASRNKPFCDVSHKDINFTATGEPKTVDSEPLEKRDGTLNLSALKDGPLIATGNQEICTGTGRTVTRTQKAALCRCGGSENKPFCDGSHQEIGFKG